MPFSNIPYRAPKYYFSDTSFNKLMRRRIYHVLLISSSYDAFMLEDDGRIDEATHAYERALGDDASLADCHYNLARLYQVQGKPKEALRHLARYRKLTGEDPD